MPAGGVDPEPRRAAGLVEAVGDGQEDVELRVPQREGAAAAEGVQQVHRLRRPGQAGAAPGWAPVVSVSRVGHMETGSGDASEQLGPGVGGG